jgi:hypothetical protein
MLDIIINRTIILFIVLIASCSFQSDNKDTFSNYMKNFEVVNLPLEINRNNLFLFNRAIYDEKTNQHRLNKYPLLDSLYYKYLTLDYNNKNYRCLYSLKMNKDYLALIIAQDIINSDNEQTGLWLYLYTYNTDGDIVDFIKIAGYNIDVIEQFVFIDLDMKIVTKQYKFLPSPDEESTDFYAMEIKTEVELSSNGKISIINNQQKEGYFLYNKGIYLPSSLENK